jgi:hypothetical protein
MKLAPDAVLAYEGAASFHGLLSLEHSIEILTAQKLRYFMLDEVIFTPVRARDPRAEEHVQKVRRDGHLYYLTSRERTLVDLLDRIDHDTDLSRLWNAFRSAGPIDSALMLAYAKKLGRALTSARLGLFLESLGGPERVEFVRRWNLIVPRAFLLHIERDR